MVRIIICVQFPFLSDIMTLKRSFIAGLGLVAMLGTTNCNDQPKMNNPVGYTGIPRNVVEVKGTWKIGPYTQGIRIEFDDYIAVTNEMALYGQDGMSFGGPGLVPHATVRTFKTIADLSEVIKDKETMTLHGDLAISRNQTPVIFNGRKVIILFDAEYNGKKYEVNRRPWDN